MPLQLEDLRLREEPQRVETSELREGLPEGLDGWNVRQRPLEGNRLPNGPAVLEMVVEVVEELLNSDIGRRFLYRLRR